MLESNSSFGPLTSANSQNPKLIAEETLPEDTWGIEKEGIFIAIRVPDTPSRSRAFSFFSYIAVHADAHQPQSCQFAF